MKFDLDDWTLMRRQSRAGMSGWYIHFISEVDTTEGLTGPFRDEAHAQAAEAALYAADELLAEADVSSPYYAGHYLWYRTQVVELTPHELECLLQPEKELE